MIQFLSKKYCFWILQFYLLSSFLNLASAIKKVKFLSTLIGQYYIVLKTRPIKLIQILTFISAKQNSKGKKLMLIFQQYIIHLILVWLMFEVQCLSQCLLNKLFQHGTFDFTFIESLCDVLLFSWANKNSPFLTPVKWLSNRGPALVSGPPKRKP